MYRFQDLLFNNNNNNEQINKGKRWMRLQLNTLNQDYINLQKEILSYVAHIGLLSVLIYNCSRIEQLNREFLKTNQKCLHFLNDQKMFCLLDSLTRIMLEKVTGFILFNGNVITSRTFITCLSNKESSTL
ncbi:hypothetical protein HUG17_4681 [Dermatophagoides farinae]|uniref:Uncharacterized protein n=1 Tax=Dermatophagoides farinae TaxID=6954 RepID=A0A9D4NZ16_DERFA|nr:hypothetical protein HUG17_4681 [Dermatophagoides farinae]